MEGLQNFVRKISSDAKSYTSMAENHSHFNSGGNGVPASLSSEQSRVLVTRFSRKMISLWTCSNLCAISLAVGVIVGYTLKRRVKRWASRLLRRLKDD